MSLGFMSEILHKSNILYPSSRLAAVYLIEHGKRHLTGSLDEVFVIDNMDYFFMDIVWRQEIYQLREISLALNHLVDDGFFFVRETERGPIGCLAAHYLSDEEMEYITDGLLEPMYGTKEHSGHVYYLKKNNDNIYKIGKSKVPPKRISDVSIQLPFPVTTTRVHAYINHGVKETFLHSLFRDSRLNGEWFQLDAERVALMNMAPFLTNKKMEMVMDHLVEYEKENSHG